LWIASKASNPSAPTTPKDESAKGGFFYARKKQESNAAPERIKNIFFGIDVKNQMLLELFEQHNAGCG